MIFAEKEEFKYLYPSQALRNIADTIFSRTENRMQPLLFHNPKPEDLSFHISEDKLPHFYDVLHFHPEFQLTAYIESTGNFYLGDKIRQFGPGDVFLIGPNIPHVSKNDPEYYKNKTAHSARSISCYFSYESFGTGFFELPEMTGIRTLLKKANRGLWLGGDTRKEVYNLIAGIKNLEGLEKTMRLIEILKIISLSKEVEPITSIGYSFAGSIDQNDRLNNVFQYTLNHYPEKIILDHIARLAHMSVASFCRYFKRRTQKTYFEFLNKIRIGQACKLLISKEKTIAEICYLCGFNNISNFNRQFKRITGYTPTQYMEKFRPEKMIHE